MKSHLYKEPPCNLIAKKSLPLFSSPQLWAQARPFSRKKPRQRGDKSLGAASKVSVNGVLIPQAYFDMLSRQAASSPPRPGAPADPKTAIREELVNREILSQAAKKKGLDKNAEVAAQMDLARQGVLIQAYLEDHVKSNPVTDEDLKKQYEQIRSQMGDTNTRHGIFWWKKRTMPKPLLPN